jgi:hypothetical protein
MSEAKRKRVEDMAGQSSSQVISIQRVQHLVVFCCTICNPNQRELRDLRKETVAAAGEELQKKYKLFTAFQVSQSFHHF